MSQSEPEDGEMFTDKAKKRLVYLSTLVSGLTALSFPLLLLLGTIQIDGGETLIQLEAIPRDWFAVYALLVASSYSYALDAKLLKRVGSVVNVGGN